jgi:hypothetical protein
MEQRKSNPVALWIGMLAILMAIALVTSLAPLEKTLGANARLVYFHGAWVWAGKIAFAAAAFSGLLGLVLKKTGWHRYSQALGWVGMVFWLTYLPLSLYVQQVNWGGIFWDEPRWRVPLMFGIVGLLLQIGLVLMNDQRITSAANLVFGVLLWWFLGSIENVLHPDSPIFGSNALRIQVFFVILLLLSIAFGALLTRQFYRYALQRTLERALPRRI